MKRFCLILLLVAAFAIFGCSADNGKELFETAELEELQNNPDHAKKLYREIIEKYPKSEYAVKARKRLEAM